MKCSDLIALKIKKKNRNNEENKKGIPEQNCPKYKKILKLRRLILSSQKDFPLIKKLL